MGKTRDLFKNIRDTKGTFHAKMGSIKDRNCVNLIEAEDWELMYTRGGFVSMYGKTNTVL